MRILGYNVQGEVSKLCLLVALLSLLVYKRINHSYIPSQAKCETSYVRHLSDFVNGDITLYPFHASGEWRSRGNARNVMILTSQLEDQPNNRERFSWANIGDRWWGFLLGSSVRSGSDFLRLVFFLPSRKKNGFIPLKPTPWIMCHFIVWRHIRLSLT